MGQRGAEAIERKGGSVKYKNNLLHMGQKLWDDLFKTGCYPTFPPSSSAPPASRKGVRNWRLFRRR